MSEKSAPADLVVLARSLCESLERRDYDAALSFFASDPVWDMSAMGMGTFRGRDPVRGLLEDWNGSYEEWEIDLEELLDMGSGVVFTVAMERAKPAGSTGRVQLRYAAVIVFAKGMVTRAITFPDIEQARAAGERLAEERG
jgi:ketosteroid isomerase-like protein